MAGQQVEQEDYTTRRPEREFEFEVVTVGKQGEITARQTCKAQRYIEELGSGVALEMVAIPGEAFMIISVKRCIANPPDGLTYNRIGEVN